MNNIAICIPTYKRPEMLRKLILSIFECKIDTLLINDVKMIIVDNDIDKTGEVIVNEINNSFDNPHKLLYFNHPVKGLSNVRNEMLNKAFLHNPDFITFIDDDEFVTQNWLNELLNVIINNNADAARGPVFPTFTNETSKYISCLFPRENYKDNSQIFSFTTGNLILRRKSLEKYNVWFDNRFNDTGAEDAYFGIQMLKKGAKIYWAEKAMVYENIPKERANLKWLIKRRFRVASTYSHNLKLEKKYNLLTKKIIVSLTYIITGIIMMIFIIMPTKKKYWGIIKFYEGIGGFAGFFGIIHKEYK